MQIDLKEGVNLEELPKELREMAENPVPFDEEKMTAALENENVKQVRVFHLEKGMRVNVKGAIYKVVAARPNGKIVLKRLK